LAGSNVSLKAEDKLFEAGDAADGMYIVRKGELKVFIRKGESDVELAKIGPGGILGEMAFFDKKPRSASVKAAADTEVTKIGEVEFNKLMAQIPKWFVAMMGSLSGRLRDTNDRLQRLESEISGKKDPFEDMLKFLKICQLIWSTKATKEGKHHQLLKDDLLELMNGLVGADAKWLDNAVKTLTSLGFFESGVDSYKKIVIKVINKASFLELHDAIKVRLDKKPLTLDENCVAAMGAILEIVNTSAYDQVKLSFDEIAEKGLANGLDTTTWPQALKTAHGRDPSLTLVKEGQSFAARMEKQGYGKFLKTEQILHGLAKAGLK
jgi:CRP/FNR family transcriptional regulator, cyclic AMP receptor protein